MRQQAVRKKKKVDIPVCELHHLLRGELFVRSLDQFGS